GSERRPSGKSSLLARRPRPEELSCRSVRIQAPRGHVLRERVKSTAHPRTIRNASGEEALCVLEDFESGPGHLTLRPESGLVEIGCMPVQGVREFVDAATFVRGGPDQRRGPPVQGGELELQIRD